MQRFGNWHRPIWAGALIIGSIFTVGGSSLITAQEQVRPAQPPQVQPAQPAQPQPAQTQPGQARPADVQAAVTEPVLVVTIGSMDKLRADIDYLAAATGQQQAGGVFAMMAGMFTQGLDTTRPIGVVVPIIDDEPEPIGLIPTTQVEAMLKRLEQQTGQAADRLEDGTFVVAAGPALVYVRQVGNWGILSREREMIDRVPADPMPLFQGLGNDYDLAFRLRVQQIPLHLREQLIELVRQGFETAAARQQGDDADLELSQVQLDQLNMLIRESDTLTFGLNVDPSERLVRIDTQFTAAPGTEMARMYRGQQPVPSMFAAVLQGDATLRYHASSSLSPELIEQTSTTYEALLAQVSRAMAQTDALDTAAQAEIKELIDGAAALVIESMREGKLDLGLIGHADDSVLRVTGGFFVHDGEEAADWVKQLAGKLQQLPDAPEFRFNEGQHGNATLHTIVVDIPADKPELRQLLGNPAEIKLATAPQAVYFAVGRGAEEDMKQLIDSAGRDQADVSDRPLAQMNVRLLPILRLAQSVKPDDSLAAVIDAVAQAENRDHFSVLTDAVENGQASRVEIGEGLLKAIGAAVRQAQAAQMQQMQRNGQF